MQLSDLKQESKLFEVIAGSIAYGTNTPESDKDIRGVFMSPVESHVSLKDFPDQISDSKSDITFFELEKFLKLAADCNPNIIELLWTPPDCMVYQHPAGVKIFEQRELFISKKAYHTFSGYAFAQIKRAKGQNKWVNNPQPKNPPNKIDFCWYIDVAEVGEVICGMHPTRNMPLRPQKIEGIDLQKMRCAKLEHVENTYRLYRDGDGVFKNEQLKVESIPIEDEWACFAGLLIYNEQAYDAAYRDWKNYHEWLKNRNEARYRSQEAGEIDYDSKSVMHCMRLLWSGGNILECGEPIVRFNGEQLEILMKIRKGLYPYEEIMEMVEEKKAELDILRDKSNLPHGSNLNAIDHLYKQITKEFWG